MIWVASINGHSSTWFCNSGVSESQLCLHCYLVFHLWWKSMCFNSSQLMGYRHWEKRTMQEGGITTVQTITSSVIHSSYNFSAAEHENVGVFGFWEPKRRELFGVPFRIILPEPTLSPLCCYPGNRAVFGDANGTRLWGSKEEQLLSARFLPGTWKHSTVATSPWNRSFLGTQLLPWAERAHWSPTYRSSGGELKLLPLWLILG